jgi:D-glycero-D-manno-heptose 1,7-bisphosphate phosphatase
MIHCTHRVVDRYESPQSAVFLDRDGTLTEYRGFITEPSQIQLCDGTCEAIHSLRSAGFAIVLITNQSAIGRGMINYNQLHAIHTELVAQLAAGNANLEAIYYCPEAPIGSDESIVEGQDRKPGPGMLLTAAKDLNLDLPNSWMVGDRISDILAGQNAGCLGNILIKSDRLTGDYDIGNQCEVCDTLLDASSIIFNSD